VHCTAGSIYEATRLLNVSGSAVMQAGHASAAHVLCTPFSCYSCSLRAVQLESTL
jgi:hypothetical protein